jgi:lysophospholipase L1-like esterase
MGDSLIEFFNWQKRFPDHHVYNFGSAGETAEGLLARLPNIIPRVQSPDLVMKIIALLQESYAQATIVMTSLLPIELFFLGDAVHRVNKRLRGIARDKHIFYLDLYPKFLDVNARAITAYYEADGVHLSEQGYEVWAKALEGTVFRSLA